MLIAETHFTNRSYIKIPNYQIYDTKHPDDTVHGGTAIIIKSSIKYHKLTELKKYYLQATSVQIEDWKGPLTIPALYCPPHHTINKDQSSIPFAVDFLSGDFNAKHTH
jgi:hypothetical protein